MVVLSGVALLDSGDDRFPNLGELMLASVEKMSNTPSIDAFLPDFVDIFDWSNFAFSGLR